jgi:hypothetical protein
MVHDRDRAARRPSSVVVRLLVVVMGAAGCSGNSPPVAQPTVPSIAAPSTTATTSTLPATTVYQPSAPQPSQDKAGAHLVAAWRAGDQAAALTDATPAAVSAVFAQPFPAGGVQARGCSTPVAGPASCIYRILADGSALQLSAVTVAGGWVVTAAQFET